MTQSDVYNLLKEKDMTKEDMAKELKIGIASINRNVSKLIQCGFICVKNVIKIPITKRYIRIRGSNIKAHTMKYSRRINVYGIKI